MLYPLRFQPLFRRYLWGGRRLQTQLGKPIGDGDDYAESWEVVDRKADQSVVQYGPRAGQTLHQLLTECGPELLGCHAGLTSFPLLFKFLDCNRVLSVQVHPNDAQASLLDPPDQGKTEAWVVMDAAPGSRIYAGLRPGVDRKILADAIATGNVESCLASFEPQAGDCLFIPAGLVHALGAGLLVAEIQQSSDATFRLFDWNRVDKNGKSRPLHIAESLDSIRFDLGEGRPLVPVPTADRARQQLVRCDKFVLDRLLLNQSHEVGGDDRFHLLAVLSGTVYIEDDPAEAPLAAGGTLLAPAACGRVQLNAAETATVLDIYLS